MEDSEGRFGRAEYNKFKIGSSEDGSQIQTAGMVSLIIIFNYI